MDEFTKAMFRACERNYDAKAMAERLARIAAKRKHK